MIGMEWTAWQITFEHRRECFQTCRISKRQLDSSIAKKCEASASIIHIISIRLGRPFTHNIQTILAYRRCRWLPSSSTCLPSNKGPTVIQSWRHRQLLPDYLLMAAEVIISRCCQSRSHIICCPSGLWLPPLDSDWIILGSLDWEVYQVADWQACSSSSRAWIQVHRYRLHSQLDSRVQWPQAHRLQLRRLSLVPSLTCLACPARGLRQSTSWRVTTHLTATDSVPIRPSLVVRR